MHLKYNFIQYSQVWRVILKQTPQVKAKNPFIVIYLLHEQSSTTKNNEDDDSNHPVEKELASLLPDVVAELAANGRTDLQLLSFFRQIKNKRNFHCQI